MRPRQNAFIFLAIYAIVATFGLSYYFVRDIAAQLKENLKEEYKNLYESYEEAVSEEISGPNASDDDDDDDGSHRLYQRTVVERDSVQSEKFDERSNNDNNGVGEGKEKGDRTRRFKQQKRQEMQEMQELESSSKQRRGGVINQNSQTRIQNVDLEPWGSFPIEPNKVTHLVTQGHPRTATTLLFNMVGVTYFLYLLQHNPNNQTDLIQASSMGLEQWKRDNGGKVYGSITDKPWVVKTHIDLKYYHADNIVVFAAAMNQAEAQTMKNDLQDDGHIVAYIQDLETLSKLGIEGLVEHYVSGFGLSDQDKGHLIPYFTNWSILRQCCGQQMSAKWRNDMMPAQYKRKDLPHHASCPNYDIDAIEQAFMNTTLYKLLDRYPNAQPLNKPSLNDDNLNGTYCSSYNYLVRTQGLSIWGVPGGRPVRSDIDNAVKWQFKVWDSEGVSNNSYFTNVNGNIDKEGRDRLRELFTPSVREVWRMEEEEKRKWLRNVLEVRGEPLEERDQKEWRRAWEVLDELEYEETGEGNETNVDDDYDEKDHRNVIEADDDSDSDSTQVDSSIKFTAATIPEDFDKTRAIFLISFGAEAAESTLVERCVLSLRRRGQFFGYVIVLTDAPPGRYDGEWDDNVIVMPPLEEHYLSADRTEIKYNGENASLKFKRFKTFVLDYLDLNDRLSLVDLVYYLDIDIMAGDELGDLFSGVESSYQILQPGEEPKGEIMSRVYFFTPLSKEWPLQGGTFILERKTSRHCLELWREEIDKLGRSGRGRDQDALSTVHGNIESGKEKKCELVRMENENWISFPTARTFDKVAQSTDYPNLIHISNSVFAKRIDETAQNEYIHKVLMLSEEEKRSGMYGKSVVRANA